MSAWAVSPGSTHPAGRKIALAFFPWGVCLITLKGSERKIKVRMTTLVPTTSAGTVV